MFLLLKPMNNSSLCTKKNKKNFKPKFSPWQKDWSPKENLHKQGKMGAYIDILNSNHKAIGKSSQQKNKFLLI